MSWCPVFHSGFIPGAPLLVGHGAWGSETPPEDLGLSCPLQRNEAPASGRREAPQDPLSWATAPARATCSPAPASPPCVPPPRRARAPRSLPPAWREHRRRLPRPRARRSCQQADEPGASERRVERAALAAREPERAHPGRLPFRRPVGHSGTEMLPRARALARGRGRGRLPGASRRRLPLSSSPAWLCCWALAACQAAWAGDLPSSSRPLPPCQEVSRTWSFTWS